MILSGLFKTSNEIPKIGEIPRGKCFVVFIPHVSNERAVSYCNSEATAQEKQGFHLTAPRLRNRFSWRIILLRFLSLFVCPKLFSDSIHTTGLLDIMTKRKKNKVSGEAAAGGKAPKWVSFISASYWNVVACLRRSTSGWRLTFRALEISLNEKRRQQANVRREIEKRIPAKIKEAQPALRIKAQEMAILRYCSDPLTSHWNCFSRFCKVWTF
ncbi:hypothetical protein BV898_01619 [Hypsibius exemplaris]|uniref:Uncharacterized protein n=1 Tax=Hypsibius exemplaris TaxID=2072580 RepID=A0A1W0XAK0_HYPEX|nr:hypothetical protein BV898_01619 [Hypsibius exemplaris]